MTHHFNKHMLTNRRSDFQLPKSATYLNCAYMSPLPKAVEAAGLTGVRRKRNPALVPAEDFFTESEFLRAEFAKLVNTPEQNRVVILPSVSYGMANVTNNVRIGSGQHVIVASEQFPSNYYPWHELCKRTGASIKAVQSPESLVRRGEQWNNRILEAIDKNTRVVALGNVHWADGTRFNLEEIRKRTRDVGALLIIDGTQSVGALPFDIQKIQPDALICGGYKWLMGPYSMCIGYYGEYFDNGSPIEHNWINRRNSEDFRSLVIYENDFQQGALRYEVGEHSNFALLPMMIAALKLINKWKPEEIQEYCRKITQRPLAKLRKAGFWIEDEDSRGYHLFGIRLPSNLDLDALIPVIRKNNITVSYRGNAIRVSPNVYNTEADLNKLVSILTAR